MYIHVNIHIRKISFDKDRHIHSSRCGYNLLGSSYIKYHYFLQILDWLVHNLIIGPHTSNIFIYSFHIVCFLKENYLVQKPLNIFNVP